MPADRFFQRHRLAVLLVSFLAPLLACALLALVRSAIDNTNAALILVLLIVAAASTGLRLAGLVAAASSAAWFDFFLTAPYGSFKINDRADIETTVLLILVASRSPRSACGAVASRQGPAVNPAICLVC
jgi:K+-sensing histidine kinase KdpD